VILSRKRFSALRLHADQHALNQIARHTLVRVSIYLDGQRSWNWDALRCSLLHGHIVVTFRSVRENEPAGLYVSGQRNRWYGGKWANGPRLSIPLDRHCALGHGPEATVVPLVHFYVPTARSLLCWISVNTVLVLLY